MRMMSFGRVGFLLLGLLLVISRSAYAKSPGAIESLGPSTTDCHNPREMASCSYYSSCVEEVRACAGSRHPYAVSFGQFYCNRFTERSAGWSTHGQRWVKEVMLCLQEELVPFVDNPADWSCRSLRNAAIGSHVGCYTKRGQSICELPINDLKSVVATLEKELWLRPQFAWQGIRVGQICLEQLKRQRDIGSRKRFSSRLGVRTMVDPGSGSEADQRTKVFEELQKLKN